MKQSKTTLKELTHRYRAVLLKCALLNLAAFAVAMPAKAEDYPFKGDLTIDSDTQLSEEALYGNITITGGNVSISDNKEIAVVNTFSASGETTKLTISKGAGVYSQKNISLSDKVKVFLERGNSTENDGWLEAKDSFSANNAQIDINYGDFGASRSDETQSAHTTTTIIDSTVNILSGYGWMYAEDISVSGNSTINVSDGAELVVTKAIGTCPDDKCTELKDALSYEETGTIDLKDSAAINLSGTMTGNIAAMGGAISFNNNSALNGKITGQLNKLTIAGGTFNDGNKLVIDGSEDITVSGGTIISNNRGAVLQHQGTGNIVVTGGTFNNNTDHEANDIVHLGSGDIKISGGTFNNSVIYKPVSCSNGYGYETCSGSSTTPVAGKIEISGGVFNNAELNSDSADGLRITGGTLNDTSVAAASGLLSIADGTFKDTEFTGVGIDVTSGKFGGYISFDEGASGINLSGGDFSNVSRFEAEGMKLNIDSDKADLTLKAGKIHHSIEVASKLTITGSKVISVAKSVVKSAEITGKITAGKDSFVGGFDGSIDKWNVENQTAYSIWLNDFQRDVTLNSAYITLNDNALAGTGDLIYEVTAFNGNIDDSTSDTVKLNAGKILTDAEINESVKLVLAELKRVDTTSKNSDDLKYFADDVIETSNSSSAALENYIYNQWNQENSLDFDKVEQMLRQAYTNYNNSVGTDSAQVNIAKSEITMNGTAGLMNGSAKDGNIVVSDNSTVVANGTNEITAKSGTVSFANSKLVVSNGANLTVATKDGNTLNLTNGTVDLSGVLNGNVSGGTLAFNSANARLNGKIANTGVEINTDIGFSALPTGLTTLKIATGKTLDIGANNLTASTITGGTISAILTDAAKNTAIVTATATDVTLKLDMSQASRDKVTQYKITNGTGFTFGDYATNRYAVSASEFDIADAKTLEKLSGWNGGDLWILRLATASEAAIEDLEKSGVVLPENEKNASKILDLASGLLDKLPEHHKKVIEKVNDLLDKAQGKAEEIKQILREIAPDASTSGSKTASNTAKSVINVINSRFGGGSPRRGRSGGDYTAGQTAVWAQGMMNYAKLDTDNGFAAHSNGVAAGFEANFTDSFKAGLGYAYTSTDISTERSTTDVKTHTGFVYGEYKPNKAYINGVVSFGRSDYDDTTRSLSLISAYKTDTIAAQIAAGYKAGVLTPEAAVRFTNVKQKAYTDALGAKMEEKTADTWTGVLGAKIGQNYALKANRKIGLSPELKVAATYDFARDDENRTVTLPDGSSYTATGEAMERFGVEAGAGVTVSIANSAEIALTYDGKFKKDYQDHTGMVNLKIKF